MRLKRHAEVTTKLGAEPETDDCLVVTGGVRPNGVFVVTSIASIGTSHCWCHIILSILDSQLPVCVTLEHWYYCHFL
jgi:hypothetical protein